MKRHGDMWGKITDRDNIMLAHEKACIGKSHYSAVKKFKRDVDANVDAIRELLVSKTFTTGEYVIEDRFESGKMRRIYKLPYFPDRVVHHALMNVVGPIFIRSMIRDTFQSLPGRGTSDARRRVESRLKADPQAYALQMDIRKYYPSVDNDYLKQVIRSKIKCPYTLWLIDDIIDSMDGLPIGGLPSQYFGNVCLTPFDWWVKQDLGVRYYYRYCDDLVFMSNSKAQLRQWRKDVESWLSYIGLSIKPTWQIVDLCKQGLDFVGYVFFNGKTRVRTRIAESLKAKAKQARRQSTDGVTLVRSLASYKGWIMQADAKQLWRRNVTPRLVRKCDGVFASNPLRGAV